MNTYSLSEYALAQKRIAFVCTCKKCGWALTAYFPATEWLSIAMQVIDRDLITKKEYFKMQHDAIQLLATK